MQIFISKNHLCERRGIVRSDERTRHGYVSMLLMSGSLGGMSQFDSDVSFVHDELSSHSEKKPSACSRAHRVRLLDEVCRIIDVVRRTLASIRCCTRSAYFYRRYMFMSVLFCW